MRIQLKNNGYALSAEFPMTVLKIQDILDKLKLPQNEPIVQFEISEYDNMEFPFALCRREFSADIYRLKLFAECLEKLEFMGRTAFKNLCDFEDEEDYDEDFEMEMGGLQ